MQCLVGNDVITLGHCRRVVLGVGGGNGPAQAKQLL